MKIFFCFLLLLIAATATSSAAISSVNFNQLRTVQNDPSNSGRVRRSPDGFDVDEMPKAKLSRGTFADEKPNVGGVKKDSGGVMAIILKFIKELFAHFNMNFDM
ncbi:hypothetical protein Bhyg_09116 [Pseudolycoriella hygida]|uniref:RxLR effector protein n=1 Tax=Pseudolycoriella hygida TaxID=35572 RepID=A0A9Q0N675_9DIPT|nr:hypothetical protein Bhyg_09116 [Pseudolycoriella hygida]